MGRRPEQAAVPTGEHVEVVSYARYSSDRQHERSIPDQERACVESCGRAGLPAPTRRYRDAALSGASMAKRIGLQELLASATEPVPRSVRRVLVVESLDRLGRNIYDSFDIVRRLHREAGMRIVTTDGRDSDSPSFKAMLLADSFVADVYLDNLRTHVRRGMEGAAARGGALGRVAFGYAIRDGRVVVDDAKARVVRRMFEQAASGVCRRAIATALAREGHVPRCTATGVGFWLRLRTYLGEVRWGDKVIRRDESLRIVDDALFERVQAVIRARDRATGLHRQPGSNLVRGGALTRKHLLSGLFRCTNCATPLVVIFTGGSRRPFAYGCRSAHERSACPGVGYVNGPRFDRAVIDEVVRTVVDSDAVDYVVRDVERRVREAARGWAGERKCLAHDLGDNQMRLHRCMEHVEVHGPSATVQARIVELEQQARTLAERLEGFDRATPAVAVLRSTIEGYLGRAADALRGVDPTRARTALEQVVTDGRVERIAKGEYRVTFRVAPLGLLRTMFLGGSGGRTTSGTTTSRRRASASSTAGRPGRLRPTSRTVSRASRRAGRRRPSRSRSRRAAGARGGDTRVRACCSLRASIPTRRT